MELEQKNKVWIIGHKNPDTDSICAAIAYTELFTEVKQIAAAQTSMLPYLAAAIFYYVFNLLVAGLMALVEKKMNYYKI